MHKLIGLAFVAVLALALAGCKQGLGEHCLLDSDCSDGLICASQQHVCVITEAAIDAGPPDLDGLPIVYDAPVRADAGVMPGDARPDARPDAQP